MITIRTTISCEKQVVEDFDKAIGIIKRSAAINQLMKDFVKNHEPITMEITKSK